MYSGGKGKILKESDIVKPYFEQTTGPDDEASHASLVLPPGGFGTGPHIMNIFAAKDRSSFLHEASHLFLEQLIHDANHPQATDAGKADLQTLKNFWASHSDEMHSQFLKAKR